MRRRTAAGLAIAPLLVAVLVSSVGWEAVLEILRGTDTGPLAAAFAAGVAIVALRGYLVHRLLVPVDGCARGIPFASAFLSGYFVRCTLPWGRSTGAPVTAYLLASNSDSEFEDNLAVVTIAEVFGFVASLAVAFLGLALYTSAGDVQLPTDLVASLTYVGSVGLLVSGMLFAVVRRGTARSALFGFATRWEAIAVTVPRLPGGNGGLESRVNGFFVALETVGAARRTLLVAFAVAFVSWVVNALPLYFSLLALGVDAPLALAFICVPLASFAGIVPAPGGTGGIEVALVGLLVATSSITGDVATAAMVLYRLTTYWLHLTLCGLGALFLSIVGRWTSE